MNSHTSYNFSFSYNLNAQPDTKPPTEDLIAFDFCHEYPLTGEQTMLRGNTSGRQTIVTNDVLYSLHQCYQFKTLKEHNLHLQKAIPDLAGQTEDINHVLNSISRTGLMLSAIRKAEELAPEPTEREEESGLCYCILTCDRPEAVSRLLQSMAKNHRFLPGNRYFLIDDSRQTGHQQQNRALCESFSREHTVNLQYFGAREQGHFQERLEQALPEHKDGIAFLLGSHTPDKATYGRSRNWALLLGAGSKLVLIDDDVLFQRVNPREQSSQAVLTSSTRDADFFSSGDTWETLSDENRPDPTTHAFSGAMGKSLPQALALATGEKLPPEAFRQLNPHDFSRFQRHSRVLITSCGSMGDPGTSSNIWLYLLDRNSRRNFYANEEQYRRHLFDRNLWFGRKDYAFLNTFVLISQITGVDARESLPPYFPLQRNEDLLFGEMVRYLHPYALQLDLPWAAPHLPLEKRRWKEGLAKQPPRHGLLSFSAEMLGRQREHNPATTPGRRLQSLADHYYCLAEISDQELLNRLAQTTLQHTTSHIRQMSDILAESPEAPGYWREDLQAIIQSLQQSLTTPSPEGFVDISGDPQTQRDSARSLWRAYATGLQAWEACTAWMQQNR
ncbi:hypothetical protein [Thiolapillus brandeum]|uniref:Uncharacterized protein n=1 Tax=Thiolapillus brandeum TaxID=1076588 RepID=A0A7U6GGX5_9GAMM|nr:hypothetical protein [Thiolapillus brandeum]BAO43436.1 conserved hypothetical protein [Thiolapillus brandeum]